MPAHQFVGKFIKGCVASYFFLYPLPIIKSVINISGDTQKVCPKLVVVSGVARIDRKQCLNEKRMLVFRIGTQKIVRLQNGGYTPNNGEIKSSNKLLISNNRVGLQALCI